jgi:spectinomycin phosphotransferase
VRAPPADVETSVLIGALADGWDFDVESAEYAAVGGGSYHWVVCDREGARGFVTADDLDLKPWLGDTRESAFDGLRRSFDTALALRESGLDFVVAPIPTSAGETVRRLGPRHTVALFPFVDGRAGRYDYDTACERAAVVPMLAELHRATQAVGSAARRIDLDVPGRGRLESALREANRTWSGGPFAEPAREVLAGHAADVAELLALADRLSADVETRGSTWVVTHGEPHAGNVMLTAERRVLIDWDTVALAPPERDLWMLDGGTGDEAAIYAEETGHRVDDVAVDFFRLVWDLKDLAETLTILRSPHGDTVDTVKAYERMKECVAIGSGRAPRPPREAPT